MLNTDTDTVRVVALDMEDFGFLAAILESEMRENDARIAEELAAGRPNSVPSQMFAVYRSHLESIQEQLAAAPVVRREVLEQSGVQQR